MSKIDYENLLNPVGSVWHAQYGYSGLDGRSFNYSANNPYMPMIEDMLRSGNYKAEEIADLYEKAYAFEGDQSNWISQLKVNEALKEEQRAYDSPEAQIKRLRDAGINPDLVGSNGSSVGSGSGSAPAVAEKPMTPTSRTDPYASDRLMLEGINTASGLISSLVNGYGVIADSISKFRMLPSQIRVNEASAGLMDAQANEINSLLSGKKKSIDLGNSLQYVGLVSDLSSLIKADASDEEFNALVSAAGIDPEHAAPTISAIKQAQSTPEFLRNYKNNILANREADAKLKTFTSEVFNNLVEEQLQLQELELDFDIISQSMSNKVQTFLQNSPGYLENLADAQTMTAQLSVDQLELAKDQFSRDLSAYQQSLDSIVEGYNSLKARNEELQKRAKDAGRELDPVEQLEIDSNILRMNSLYSLGSQQVNNVYGILDGAYRQKFYLENNTKYDSEKGLDRTTQKVVQNGVAGWLAGKLAGRGLSDDTLLYGQIAFGDVLQGVYTTHDLVKQYGDLGISLSSNLLQYNMLRRFGSKVLGTSPSSPNIIQEGSNLTLQSNLQKFKDIINH